MQAMASTTEVRPVRTASELRKFILYPWKLYRGNPYWVAPLVSDQKLLLDPRKNPFFEHSEVQHFLAFRDGRIAGRISAIVDRNYVEFQQEKAGFFGFFECSEDEEVARALFTAAEGWLRERGMQRMIGPTNPSTNDTVGLLADAFDQYPVLHMPYNFPYYLKLCEAAGLTKARDLYAYYMENTVAVSEKIKRVAELVQKRRKVTVRPINMKKLFTEEIELIKTVYNDAWTRNWGFVPWTEAELEHTAKDLKKVVEPDMVLLAFVDGEIAGFILSLPDLNIALRHIRGRLFPFGLVKVLWHARKIDMVRTLAMGVRKKFQGLGLDAIFYYESWVRGKEHGFNRGEMSWILEDNYAMRNPMEKWGARIYKTYRMYGKEL
jgi:GNAT superfamily N-acetyltransferase